MSFTVEIVKRAQLMSNCSYSADEPKSKEKQIDQQPTIKLAWYAHQKSSIDVSRVLIHRFHSFQLSFDGKVRWFRCEAVSLKIKVNF